MFMSAPTPHALFVDGNTPRRTQEELAMTTIVASPAPFAPSAPTRAESDTFTRAATGGPRALLRLEGAVLLVAACLGYAQLGGSWVWFAALFLVPDLSMLGYLAGPRGGAAAYNLAHSNVTPALLAALSVLLAVPALSLGALIWLAHIGFDRMLGYGLKYGTAFGDTHLGRVGWVDSRASSSAMSQR
jgi:hypothetical protein